MTTDASTPAFPATENTLSAGLTKREWYAGLAMQGAIASQTPDESIDPEMCAQWCFEMADAMIAEGSK